MQQLKRISINEISYILEMNEISYILEMNEILNIKLNQLTFSSELRPKQHSWEWSAGLRSFQVNNTSESVFPALIWPKVLIFISFVFICAVNY